jgi:hypothetical protein
VGNDVEHVTSRDPRRLLLHEGEEHLQIEGGSQTELGRARPARNVS